MPLTNLEAFHEGYGGEYVELGGRRIIDHYGRPARTHLAVRNGVGVTEQPEDVVVVSGEDRVAYVDNVLSNAIPAEHGRGCYALLLSPQGRIDLDLYVYTAEDRLLLFVPPGRAADLVEEWREKVFIQDVTFEIATADYAIIGIHGPQSTEKLASVVPESSIPQERFAFTSATLEDAGVTVISTDAPLGEESYAVVGASYDAAVVIETLVNRGLNAVPFGHRSWNTLTLEAGTPLLDPDFAGELPNVVGLRNALDFEKGCFVGQEVVSRVENRGRPNQRLVGLLPEALPDAGADVLADGESIGRVTRAAKSPVLDRPIAFALVPFDGAAGSVDVRVGGEPVGAAVTALPFVEGSAQSGRLPTYPDLE